ncbi:MAG: hypothetical protein A2700_02870 [Candidatus Blackburnbacteria bacterium RIFCSPHIGHO2_01_FULL_44_64]|uniref:DUF3048 domain-containing protein n=1 Tax=Candidatus Blackburnbacteria bacterium RIFCSPHIGHO2_02_FULL_44_20 TaxID=1797516 RepID=A0A1G1V869_9BACT|nr:MAG: hypothetical protein A2700_02870 [Candidatus Blackburnbacteria bacterium RIFCSPHIGHO2_01_FULL_44_64]OGY11427.1 MAG: hypothetical protein A3E16_03090 [Candidatus Blackburnbacteria bacterium RIFCSPHIGHO2_12_FULL_44_25]OGY11625.1 MAG: hypothetical protein A3D26_02045 [Candidatus Blackburnbacteria bacterium RIFCSPHIGHO2_02_FULL_44_20]OGY14173.1 MAG: hypothetical protein A3A62_01845 [Candidatus Blackburnbacteria bacterium RIFCSPLOWO2_01_FULL_44_43]
MITMKNIAPKVLGGLFGLYLISAGISYLLFTYVIKSPQGINPQNVAKTRGKIDASAPKTEECPINGKMFTKAEREIWEKRRPLTVMIENHEESRPQSGLSSADVIYEAIAEGGITRFMGVFYCGASAEEVMLGPVRSARTYFLDMASEYADYPLYAHVGGANRDGPADALQQIINYGWDGYNDLNQFSIGFPTFRRDYERLGRTVATEHTMYSTTDKLWDVASERELTNEDKKGNKWNESYTPWKFTDGKASASPQAASISFPFWAGYSQYAVKWTYDAATNTYKRDNGGVPHQDLNNDQQLDTTNVAVLFMKLRSLNDAEKHMLYTTTGTGNALVFNNGDVVKGTWSKKDRISRTIIKDSGGREIPFVRGPIWIEILDPATTVSY